jgi:hypothetical protein
VKTNNTGIAACWNVWKDAKALRGSLEIASQFFDNLFVICSPPGGEKNKDDETCDLLREFGIDPKFADINDGFGLVRTRLIHECGEEWAFILDADERFYPALPVMVCMGEERYPLVEHPKLGVATKRELIYQGQHIRHLCECGAYDAIKTIRRHWFDFSMERPCENWISRKDWQLRVVRNVKEIGYQTGVKMHERIVDTRINDVPRHYTADDLGGPFHDHFHMFYRRAFPGKKEANEQNYQRLEKGEPMMP